MHTVCIIPARGGSKRIPRKNVRLFAGLPMIAHSIRAAQGAGIFGRVPVSTDDDEITDMPRAQFCAACDGRPTLCIGIRSRIPMANLDKIVCRRRFKTFLERSRLGCFRCLANAISCQ
jgi:CMP-2-keto-3-deoxyoctulosonic acid synthetase